ncbi:MAG: 4Fe-4S dicluster domain-containing protein [Chloroflexota bacterium]
MSQVIAREDLSRWLNSLMEERTVVVPVVVGDMVFFRPVAKAEDMTISRGNATLGPKGCLFPLSHTMFTVEQEDGDVRVIPSSLEREMVVFGLRPCDAQGLAVFDLPMLAEPADQYYRERREKTALVGLACAEACAECFCTSTGGGPHDARYMDVMLSEVPQGYLVQAVTEKGKKLLAKAPLKDMAVQAPTPPDVPRVPTDGIVAAMRRTFADKYWSRLADRCIHCNICSYVCPTCYCFDIRDYQQDGKTHRVRSWESCQAPGFTKIAGGHDPRADKGSRMRQRFAHKLLYFPEEFNNVLGCTGCGRCVRYCPVNIDIREIISDVQKIGGG